MTTVRTVGAKLKTDFINGRTANWAPKVASVLSSLGQTLNHQRSENISYVFWQASSTNHCINEKIRQAESSCGLSIRRIKNKREIAFYLPQKVSAVKKYTNTSSDIAATNSACSKTVQSIYGTFCVKPHFQSELRWSSSQTDSTLTAVNMKKSWSLCPNQEVIKVFVYAAIISPWPK